MKITIGVLSSAVIAASVLALAPTVPVKAQQEGRNVCLNIIRIRNTQAIDDRTIEYRMWDGSVWRNTLAAPCPHLVSQAVGTYTQVSHDSWICANTQHITLKTGLVCRLGEFSRVK